MTSRTVLISVLLSGAAIFYFLYRQVVHDLPLVSEIRDLPRDIIEKQTPITEQELVKASFPNAATTTSDMVTYETYSGDQKTYIPQESVVYPVETWVSEADVPINFLEFSFMLPAGWHGSVYENNYGGGVSVLVHKSHDTVGFSITCPPPGKGFEAATVTLREDRLFISNNIRYLASFERWTSVGNDPWLFVQLRGEQVLGSSEHVTAPACIVQGDATPDIEIALRMLFESLN